MRILEEEKERMEILLKKCEKDTLNVTLGEMYDIIYYYQREAKSGAIRFPKRIRDLWEKVSEGWGKDKRKLTSEMIDAIGYRKPKHENRSIKYSHINFNTHIRDKRW